MNLSDLTTITFVPRGTHEFNNKKTFLINDPGSKMNGLGIFQKPN